MYTSMKSMKPGISTNNAALSQPRREASISKTALFSSNIIRVLGPTAKASKKRSPSTGGVYIGPASGAF